MAQGLRNVLTLNADRSVRDGSTTDLVDAIRRGADLRIGTAFRHNEHIDTASPSNELIEEVAEFRQTLLLDDRWAAGIMTLRMPVELPEGFGPRPSMSFFLYNQDGTQAIARPYLDGEAPTGAPVRLDKRMTAGDFPPDTRRSAMTPATMLSQSLLSGPPSRMTRPGKTSGRTRSALAGGSLTGRRPHRSTILATTMRLICELPTTSTRERSGASPWMAFRSARSFSSKPGSTLDAAIALRCPIPIRTSSESLPES